MGPNFSSKIAGKHRTVFAGKFGSPLRLPFCHGSSIKPRSTGYSAEVQCTFFSTTQFEELIDWKDGPLLTSLLDIGAGDGFTTELMRKFFTQVYVTEMSKPMKWALSEKGFTVLNETSLNETNQRFSVISCLNVLDRCDQPLQMLNQIKRLVQVGGIAVVAFVIPYKPYVEFQSETHAPSERLPINGPNFEAEIVNFVTKVLEPNGWELVKWTRLPYLCQGDIHQAYYWLDDAVFVIRPKEQN